MERIAWRAAMKAERGVVLRRALLQKTEDIPIHILLRKNERLIQTSASLTEG
jgi:hypothetical protein